MRPSPSSFSISLPARAYKVRHLLHIRQRSTVLEARRRIASRWFDLFSFSFYFTCTFVTAPTRFTSQIESAVLTNSLHTDAVVYSNTAAATVTATVATVPVLRRF